MMALYLWKRRYWFFYKKLKRDYKIKFLISFKKIAQSEAKHMEAVKALLDRYDIETPTNDHWDKAPHSVSPIGREVAQKYKKAINAKYWKIISAMSDERLKTLVEKIDVLSEKVENSSDYSDTQKQKYKYILWALKEIV